MTDPQAQSIPQPAPLPAAEIIAITEAGSRLVRFAEPIEPQLDRLGVLPLPPYIHEPLADPERYQTVFGHVEGSVAAPTAGLHFTPELLIELRRAGIDMAFLTLHIGLDTFRPVKTARVKDHQIHTEWYELTASVSAQINQAQLEGRRVVAVGTTVVRALESAARACSPLGQAPIARANQAPDEIRAESGQSCGWRTVSAFAGPTELFIYPGYSFRVVDAMLTNFHLPRSTLLMLVSAFANPGRAADHTPSAGRDLIMRAYGQAIKQGYRFFSFGDAMLLL